MHVYFEIVIKRNIFLFYFRCFNLCLQFHFYQLTNTLRSIEKSIEENINLAKTTIQTP